MTAKISPKELRLCRWIKKR